MSELLRLFINIVLLRAGPQDVPASRTLLQFSLLFAAISYFLAIISIFPVGQSVMRVILDLVVMALFLYIGLSVRRHSARFVQAFTALCGSGAILNLIAWPLFLLLTYPAPPSLLLSFAALLLWGLYAWSVLVTGHIFRHSLDTSLVGGILVALMYVFVAQVSTEFFLPIEDGTGV